MYTNVIYFGGKTANELKFMIVTQMKFDSHLANTDAMQVDTFLIHQIVASI
jgi:hypothetical protein